MKILLTGKDGQIGWELQRTLAPLGDVVAFGRDGLDLADLGALSAIVRALQPDVIVNAAAYTAVDQAQKEPQLAMRLNAEAPGVLAREATSIGGLLVHISTDYVFDGRKNSPYVEDDAVNPINSYGMSKLAGETAVRAAGGRHLILRTSWIYAARGRNFLKTILRLARERDELRVVSDQIGAPTWSRLVAEAIAHLVVLSRAQHSGVPGTYHLTTGGETSWHGFAQEAIAQATKLTGLKARAHTITPIPSYDYPLPAQRPLNSRLSNARLQAAFALRLPDWQTALRLCLEDAAQSDPLLAIST
jgi:dTDP-4-dehydrorhamnose reductase